MQWLEKYTFPAESRIDADVGANVVFISHRRTYNRLYLSTQPNGLGYSVYTRLVARLIEEGITTVAFHGTQSLSVFPRIA